MHRIRTDFKYDPKATVISTPLGEVFEKRHGVCQDFAHVMIAGLRGPRSAGGLCQRLSAHHSAAGPAAPAGRRRHPCLGVAVVRRGSRLDRLRSDQRSAGRQRSHHPGDRRATSPTSRRSTASSSDRASRSSASRSTCCWWSDFRPPGTQNIENNPMQSRDQVFKYHLKAAIRSPGRHVRAARSEHRSPAPWRL